MHVQVEVRQIPEGLHEQDQSRPGARRRLGVRISEQAGGDPAKLTQPRPMPAEDGAQEPRDGEHVLAMRRRLPDSLFFASPRSALPSGRQRASR